MNFRKTLPHLGLACLWMALVLALACHGWAAFRGLEITDEASYLLLALDPWNTMGHGSLHGFFLHPIYLLGGSSVAGLRILGFAFTLGAAFRLASSIRGFVGVQNRRELAGIFRTKRTICAGCWAA